MDLMSFPVCQQCFLAHPPVPEGQKCPMAKEKTGSGKEIKFDDFFVNLKNILSTNIQKNKIEDTKKFFGYILVNIIRIAEEYKQ